MFRFFHLFFILPLMGTALQKQAVPIQQQKECHQVFTGDNTVSKKTHRKEWMSFEEAKAFIQSHDITTLRKFHEWSSSGERPSNFPSNPQRNYKGKWKSWRDFLGTENVSKKGWMSFEEAKAFIQSRDITTSTEFYQWASSGERPPNFPSRPRIAYKEKWTGWGDFLGIEKGWMSFEEAKAFIQSLGITTLTEFHKWSSSGERPSNFPSNPQRNYKEKWTGWGDFLGTGNVSKKGWMRFEKAKALIQSLGITTSTEFYKWSSSGERPPNFPSQPKRVYKKKWKSWRDFLGTIKWMSYKKAQHYATKVVGLTTVSDLVRWLQSEERPENFPPEPQNIYTEWTNAYDFLRIKWPAYADAHIFNKHFLIDTKEKYYEWREIEDFETMLPPNPAEVYKEYWTGWEAYLAH